MKQGKTNWATVIAITSVGFGMFVGSGFATGQQSLSFFVKYGWLTVIFPIIAVAIFSLSVKGTLDVQHYFGVQDYRSWANVLYHPFDKILGPVFEVVATLCGMLGVSAAMAGGAQMFAQSFGFNYRVMVVVLGIVFMLFGIFGPGLLRKISTLITVVMLVCLIITYALCIRHGYLNLSNILSTFETFDTSFGDAVLGCLRYAGFTTAAMTSLIAVTTTLKTTRENTHSCILMFVLNGVMLLFSCLAMLSWMPGISGEALPILAILNQMGYGWLAVVYQITLFLALMSTACPIILSFVERFLSVGPWKKKEDIPKKRIALGIIYIFANCCIAFFGLIAVINKGYGYMGLLNLFFYIIPAIVIAPIKMRKYRKAEREGKPLPNGYEKLLMGSSKILLDDFAKEHPTYRYQEKTTETKETEEPKV